MLLNSLEIRQGWGTAMEIEKERNRIALERILFHLDEAMRFCHQLDLTGLGP
jgi:hypothetical protein